MMVKKSVGRKAKGVYYEGQKLLYQNGEHHLRVGYDSKLKLYVIYYNSKKITKSTFPNISLPKLTSRELNEIANIFFAIREELDRSTHKRLDLASVKESAVYCHEAKLVDIFSDKAEEVLRKLADATDDYAERNYQNFLLDLKKERRNLRNGNPLSSVWIFFLDSESNPEDNSLYVFYDKIDDIPNRLKQANELRMYMNREYGRNYSSHLFTTDKENIIGAYDYVSELSNEYIIEKFLELLEEDKHKVAALSGIEQFARLEEIKPKNKITLKKIGNIYFERKIKPLKDKNKKDAKAWWSDFVKIVKKVYLSDVTLDDINNYQSKIHGLRDDGDLSSTWVKHRFDMVKTILKNSLKFIEDTQDVRRVLDWCHHFHYPAKREADPKPISKEHFHELLNYCQGQKRVKWEAILLLSLNCGLYLKDIKDLKWEHLNLENKTLIMRRVKTGILRVCCLWGRTIDALERYQETVKHTCDSVFVGKSGLPYKTQSSRDCFNKRIKKNTSVPKEVKFNHIRDGAITAAIRSRNPEQHIKLFSGHSCGITDKYAMRDPFIVKEVCEAIEEYYFSDDN